MSSRALHRWKNEGQQALDEIEAAHRSLGGKGPGRRYATKQINQAYTVLLTSQFQKFCRDLHSEGIKHLTKGSPSDPRYAILEIRLIEARKLDTGNPNPGNLGSDFGRFGMDFWDMVRAHNPRNIGRQRQLSLLNEWRNAIAHQNFEVPTLKGRSNIRLAEVRAWRATCNALAASFDAVVKVHIGAIIGRARW
jgi:hypothetical protein